MDQRLEERAGEVSLVDSLSVIHPLKGGGQVGYRSLRHRDSQLNGLI
jgi:hypothetical protein